MKKKPIQISLLASYSGLTLIELAIGMAIIGILLFGALLVGNRLWDEERRYTTREYLDETKITILDFVRKEGRFPRMDMSTDINAPGNGEEEIDPVVYDRLYGWVPYKTLAINKDDSFSKRVLYFVNWQLAKPGGVMSCNALNNFFKGIIVSKPTSTRAKYITQSYWDNPVGQDMTWYPRVALKSDITNFGLPVAAVLISSGQDKKFSATNIAGRQVVNTFFEKNVQTGAIEQPGYFDDIVVYITMAEAYEALNCK